MVSTSNANLIEIKKGLGRHLFPVNVLTKQKQVLRHTIYKSFSMTVKCYTLWLINFNEYTPILPRYNDLKIRNINS